MKYFLFIVLTLCLNSCGTHGSIKGYQYPTNKENLEQAVMSVIKNNPNIYRDTNLDYLGSSPALDSLNSPNSSTSDFSAGENYYNDIKHYVTIKITSGRVKNEYVFRYYGDDEDWKTSSSSEIFICYARDKYGSFKSEGGGGLTRKTKKEFIEVFEKEFVDKIDKELNLTHVDD